MEGYTVRRERWYGPLRELFPWETIAGDEYALASWTPVAPLQCHELQEAAEGLAALWHKVALIVSQGDCRLLRWLGLPAGMREAIREALQLPWLTALGRFDFVWTSAGWKVLEYNCDTPSGVVEALAVNGRICACEGRGNPNGVGEELLRQAIAESLYIARRAGLAGATVFSALGSHSEDAGTMKYWQTLAAEGLFVPLEELRYEQEVLTSSASGEISCWFRLHPWEIMVKECAADGFPTGRRVLELVARKKLLAINPPLALVGQSKALQALVWQLYEAKEFLTHQERQLVRTYMLPTYRQNVFLGRSSYVRKPLWGREGGGVTLHAADGSLLAGNRSGWHGAAIYQEAVELERVQVMTQKGLQEGRRLWGVFVAGGSFAGLLVRLGPVITDDRAWVTPVYLKEEGSE